MATATKDCNNCQHFTPCPCAYWHNTKGKCAADGNQTVYISQNKNCPEWQRKN